jgi:hypothetical protein
MLSVRKKRSQKASFFFLLTLNQRQERKLKIRKLGGWENEREKLISAGFFERFSFVHGRMRIKETNIFSIFFFFHHQL